MATLVLLEAAAKTEHLPELRKFLQLHIPATRSFDGCQGITAYLHEDGKTVVMVEHWDSKGHYEKYLAWRQETGVLAELGALLEGGPSIRFFESIDA